MVKRRRKIKKSFKYLLTLILLIGISFGVYYFVFKDKNSFSKEAKTVIETDNLDVLKLEYSKTLDNAIASGKYNKEYFEAYSSINYHDQKNFIDIINTLLDKGYSADEINNIFDNLGSDNITKLTKNDYLDLSEFFAVSNFDVDNYKRYMSYAGKKDAPITDIVTYVNIGLDNEFYSVFNEVNDPSDYLVIVNKYNKLPSSYVPNDLVSLSDTPGASSSVNYQLRKIAAEAFTKMYNDAKKDGHILTPFSAYRSYSRQNELYAGYVSRDGAELADTYSARPGHSEHQTGLAIDVQSKNEVMKLNDSDYKWVEDNSYKYGFIIRYPQGKIDITGYMYEDWHLRYIGIEHATKVHELNITYDEYYDLYIK